MSKQQTNNSQSDWDFVETSNIEVDIKTVIEDVVRKCSSSNEELQAKIIMFLESLRKDVEVLKDGIETLKHFAKNEKKVKSLEIARGFTDLGSFKYYSKLDGSHGAIYPSNSSDLVKEVLGYFMLGKGYKLPQNAYTRSFLAGATMNEKKALFREKFAKHVQDLIGHEPRLETDGDDSWTMYYS